METDPKQTGVDDDDKNKEEEPPQAPDNGESAVPNTGDRKNSFPAGYPNPLWH